MILHAHVVFFFWTFVESVLPVLFFCLFSEDDDKIEGKEERGDRVVFILGCSDRRFDADLSGYSRRADLAPLDAYSCG